VVPDLRQVQRGRPAEVAVAPENQDLHCYSCSYRPCRGAGAPSSGVCAATNLLASTIAHRVITSARQPVALATAARYAYPFWVRSRFRPVLFPYCRRAR
jgi:hypothetical protein